MFKQQRALEERVPIENYASKSNDFRTCKISKVLFLTESEITVVAKELKKTLKQSRFIYSQSVKIPSKQLSVHKHCRVTSVNSVKHPGRAARNYKLKATLSYI